jgi:hypothetical protein
LIHHYPGAVLFDTISWFHLMKIPRTCVCDNL